MIRLTTNKVLVIASYNDSEFLERTFSSTRKIRKIIEDMGQAGSFDPTESKNKN